jgi:hypothetical protein
MIVTCASLDGGTLGGLLARKGKKKDGDAAPDEAVAAQPVEETVEE